MKLLLNTLLFLGFASICNAQHDFRSGFIVKSPGDTLRGEIDYRGDTWMSKFCRFRTSPTEDFTEYSPMDLHSFRFTGDKYFISREITVKKEVQRVFLEFIVKGKLDVFYYRDVDGDHYLIEKEGRNLTELPYEEEIVQKQDGSSYIKRTTKHIGILSSYLYDQPKIVPRLNQLKDSPDHNNMISIAKEYHKMSCNDEKCIVYQRKKNFLRINPEILTGAIDYSVPEIIDSRYIQAGILLHFWLPRANEKLFFRSGCLLSNLKVKNGNLLAYKIPIHFEYMFPKRLIRPYASYGLNVYTPFFNSFSSTVSFNVGVRLKLYNKVYLSIGSDLEFYQDEEILIIPQRWMSKSLHTGLYYQF